MPDRFTVLSSGAEPETPQVRTEWDDFMDWWPKHAATLNSRATLVWQELAWSGWFARSEVAEGKIPTVFPRRAGE